MQHQAVISPHVFLSLEKKIATKMVKSQYMVIIIIQTAAGIMQIKDFPGFSSSTAIQVAE